MGLREDVEQDMREIHEDTDDFGWEFFITAPSGQTHVDPLYGLTNDIAQVIDPDTGQVVSGRSASISIPMQSLYDAGFTELPRGISSTASRPWIVSFDDITGNNWVFKVSQSNPDRGIGNLVLMLEIYNGS